MEETIIEIPDTPDDGWQPPVLKHQKAGKSSKAQNCTDVFFIQYVVCILLVTAVFIIRLYDEMLCDSILGQFAAQTHAPDAQFIGQLASILQR